MSDHRPYAFQWFSLILEPINSKLNIAISKRYFHQTKSIILQRNMNENIAQNDWYWLTKEYLLFFDCNPYYKRGWVKTTFYHRVSCQFSLWFHPCMNRTAVQERVHLCLFGRHFCRYKASRMCRHATPLFFLWVGFVQTFVSWNGQKGRQVTYKTIVHCNILTT